MLRSDAKVGDKVWTHFLFSVDGSGMIGRGYVEQPCENPMQVEVIALDQTWRVFGGLWRVRRTPDADGKEWIVFPVDCTRSQEEAIEAYKRADAR